MTIAIRDLEHFCLEFLLFNIDTPKNAFTTSKAIWHFLFVAMEALIIE